MRQVRSNVIFQTDGKLAEELRRWLADDGGFPLGWGEGVSNSEVTDVESNLIISKSETYHLLFDTPWTSAAFL